MEIPHTTVIWDQRPLPPEELAAVQAWWAGACRAAVAGGYCLPAEFSVADLPLPLVQSDVTFDLAPPLPRHDVFYTDRVHFPLEPGQRATAVTVDGQRLFRVETLRVEADTPVSVPVTKE